MGRWLGRREPHVCAQVTAGEVDAVALAARTAEQLNDVVAMGPMIESLVDDLAKVRNRNNFAGRFRAAFREGGGG